MSFLPFLSTFASAREDFPHCQEVVFKPRQVVAIEALYLGCDASWIYTDRLWQVIDLSNRNESDCSKARYWEPHLPRHFTPEQSDRWPGIVTWGTRLQSWIGSTKRTADWVSLLRLLRLPKTDFLRSFMGHTLITFIQNGNRCERTETGDSHWSATNFGRVLPRNR